MNTIYILFVTVLSGRLYDAWMRAILRLHHGGRFLPVAFVGLIEGAKRLIVVSHADYKGCITGDALIAALYRKCGSSLCVICCYPQTVKDQYPIYAKCIMGNWYCPTLVSWRTKGIVVEAASQITKG
jgi:hypothetical protein